MNSQPEFPQSDVFFNHPEWPEGIITLDVDGLIVAISPKAEEILKVDAHSMLSQHIHSALCANYRGLEHDLHECPLVSEQTHPDVGRSTFWVTGEGDYDSVDFRSFDVSEGQKKFRFICFHSNQNKLFNQSELEKFAQYAEQSPTAMAEFDVDGQVVFANPSMQNLMVLEGFGETGEARIQPSNLLELLEQIAADAVELHHLEVEVGERSYRWHFLPMLPVPVKTVIGYVYDATDLKINEMRLEREKAEARRDFFAKMVHELRTPLNAIIGFSQILIKRLDSKIEPRDLKNLKSIRISGLQLNEMISDTLDISKIDAGKMELDVDSFKVADVLHAIQDQMFSLAEAKGLAYSVSCNESLVLSTDRKKLRQILVNLISNGIKYTRSGQVAVTCDQQGDEVVFCVEDTGIGIPEDQLSDLFGAYSQVAEKQNKNIQGTGLGLALVAELVNMLSGSISVESEYRNGSCFTVRLPQTLSFSLDGL